MKKTIKRGMQSSVAAVAIAAFPVAAFAQESSESEQQSPKTQTEQSGTSGQSQASSGEGKQMSTLPEKLQELVNNVAQTNMQLITLGIQAQAKAQSEQVRKFATKSVEDNVDAQKELAKIARDSSFEIELQGGESQKIEGQGMQWEQKYLQQVQQLQQKLAKQLEGQETAIQNEDLKKFVTKQLSQTLKDLNQTQKLAQSLQKGAPPAIGEGPKEESKQE